MWTKLKGYAMATLLGIIGLLFIAVQHYRGVSRDNKRKAEKAREDAAAAQAMRDLDRDIQAARGVVQREAKTNEQALQERARADNRPAVFGDQRLRDRA